MRVEPEGGVDLAGRARAVEGVEVQAGHPQPRAGRRTARWPARRPPVRTASAPPSSSAASRRSCIQAGAAAPMAPIRRMVPSEVTGMMPGSTGVRNATCREVGHQPLVLGRLEEELGDAEVGQLQLGRQEVPVAGRSGERGWPAGWAATPMEKPPMARASSTSSMA